MWMNLSDRGCQPMQQIGTLLEYFPSVEKKPGCIPPRACCRCRLLEFEVHHFVWFRYGEASGQRDTLPGCILGNIFALENKRSAGQDSSCDRLCAHAGLPICHKRSANAEEISSCWKWSGQEIGLSTLGLPLISIYSCSLSNFQVTDR